VPSPLLYRGGLYSLKSNSGILTQLDAKTGEPRYSLQRLEAVPNVYASPVAADGRIYIVGREGTTVVLAAGPTLRVLATNTLEDRFDASPALVDAEMYLRGRRHLYRISEQVRVAPGQALRRPGARARLVSAARCQCRHGVRPRPAAVSGRP
jgi:outer membrane protein assembly factor BamB